MAAHADECYWSARVSRTCVACAQSTYLERSRWLADINNERDEKKESYKANMIELERCSRPKPRLKPRPKFQAQATPKPTSTPTPPPSIATLERCTASAVRPLLHLFALTLTVALAHRYVLVEATQDSTVVPHQSETHGFYAWGDVSEIETLRESKAYLGDYVGLRTLDESGRLFIHQYGERRNGSALGLDSNLTRAATLAVPCAGMTAITSASRPTFGPPSSSRIWVSLRMQRPSEFARGLACGASTADGQTDQASCTWPQPRSTSFHPAASPMHSLASTTTAGSVRAVARPTMPRWLPTGILDLDVIPGPTVRQPTGSVGHVLVFVLLSLYVDRPVGRQCSLPWEVLRSHACECRCVVF